MDIASIRLSESLIAKSDLGLTEFCALFSNAVKLPLFVEDGENETEWAEAGDEVFSVNVSRPYDVNTLHKWHTEIPLGYNFDVSIHIGRSAPLSWTSEWLAENIIPTYGSIIANICQCDVLYLGERPRMIAPNAT